MVAVGLCRLFVITCYRHTRWESCCCCLLLPFGISVIGLGSDNESFRAPVVTAVLAQRIHPPCTWPRA